MINRVFRLVAPKQISVELCPLSAKGRLLVRPEYLSICAADQRYYNGLRPREAMLGKLPMALVHEACGVVARDPSGELAPGQRVILVPNQGLDKSGVIRDNYAEPALFCSSGSDGFTREYVAIERRFVVPYSQIEPPVAALCELFSVALHSVESLMETAHENRGDIAVFGDGNLGYVCALAVKTLMPKSRLTVFGLSDEKLSFFSFADRIFRADMQLCSPRFDHALECVGGERSAAAIDSIISGIRPQGCVMLLGVSENPVPINTRAVLEKGLSLIGRSRSTARDIAESARLFENDPSLRRELAKIIRTVTEVRDAAELCRAFDEDYSAPFKTVIKWNV